MSIPNLYILVVMTDQGTISTPSLDGDLVEAISDYPLGGGESPIKAVTDEHGTIHPVNITPLIGSIAVERARLRFFVETPSTRVRDNLLFLKYAALEATHGALVGVVFLVPHLKLKRDNPFNVTESVKPMVDYVYEVLPQTNVLIGIYCSADNFVPLQQRIEATLPMPCHFMQFDTVDKASAKAIFINVLKTYQLQTTEAIANDIEQLIQKNSAT